MSTMKTYFYEGVFSPHLVRHVLQHPAKFDATMRSSIEAFGGRLLRCHLRAISNDPIGFVQFDEDVKAFAWNTFYAEQEGVSSSRIERVLDEADLATVAGNVDKCATAALAHRAAASGSY